MKRLFLMLAFGGLTSWCYGAGGASDSLTVSSGTFKAIDGFTNNNGNFRQAIAVGDSSTTYTQGVNSSSSAYVNFNGVGQPVVSTSMVITGSLPAGSNVIGGVTQSGTWTIQPGNTQNSTPWQVISTNTILGTGSNAVGSITNTGFNVNNTPTVNPGNIQNTTPWQVISTNTVLGTGSNTIGALSANQSVNVAQVGGNSISTGSGVNGGGVARVTMATDQVAYGVNSTTSPVNNAGTPVVFVSTFANVTASSTDWVMVAGLASTKLCVHQVVFEAGGTATTLVFNTKPAGAGTAVSATFANGANGGAALNWSPVAWFCTNSADGLSATTGAGSTTGVHLVYGKE